MRRAPVLVMCGVTGMVLVASMRASTHVSVAGPAQVAAPTASPSAVPARTASPRPAATTSTVVVNGTSVDTRYGPVQVQITLAGHRIVRADAIDYPQSGGRDIEINRYAIPQLDDETLRAQSGQVDTVSGATYTSEGYRLSLQAALDAAHAAGQW